MITRIGIASDLHLEMSPGLHPASGLPECELLLLCGDVAVGEGACEAMRAIAESGICEHLVWVAGNHEFYRSDIDARREQYRAAFNDHPRIHYLDDSAIQLYGLTILGSTLWTGFDVLGRPYVKEAMAAVLQVVAGDTAITLEDHARAQKFKEFRVLWFRPVICSHDNHQQNV